MDTPEVVIFVPRVEEHSEIEKRLAESEFAHFTARAVLTGPGKINTAAAVAAFAARIAGRKMPPPLVIGAGLCGSLNMKLAAGETVISDSAVIGDWLMEDDQSRTYGLYGDHSYKALDSGQAEALAINGRSRPAEELLIRLTAKGFCRGRLLSTDTYMTGLAGKLERGRLFNCLACDHESGPLALVALNRLPETPWLNLRVVADTIGERLGGEGRNADPVEVLALKLLVALAVFDANFPRCVNCGGCGASRGF